MSCHKRTIISESESRNILIIHFGLLLKERTLDSIGHDLWKKYNIMVWILELP